MPPKRAPRRVAAVASDGDRQGSDPGSFQLPPYWEDRPELWFNQAEGLMRGRKITDPIYQAVLVQTALTRPQQEAVAHILELSPPPSDVFQQLRAELIRIHGKSEWKRMGELFALPPLGGQRPGELLMQMKRLRPSEADLWFRWQFFSRLPAWMQRQLAEDAGTVEQLAARAEDLMQKAPEVAAVAAEPTEVVAAAHVPQPKKQWPKKKFGDRKRRRSEEGTQGGRGGQGSSKKRDTPWARAGMCWAHYKFGEAATTCQQPCNRAEN